MLLLESFSHHRQLRVFQWSLSDSKSPQVSRTLLSILADLNNAVVWIVSTRLVISKSSSLCTNPFVTVSRAPITVGIAVTFMFHSFFNSLARSRYLFLFSLSFNFTLYSAGTGTSTILQVLSFLLIIIRSGCLTEIKWPLYISKSEWSLCASFSRTDSGLCIYFYYYYLFFLLLWEFFTAMLAEGLPREFE